MKAILALDQGTTSSRAILFDASGAVCRWRKKSSEKSKSGVAQWNERRVGL
ncbi:MAG: hypothetical protein M3P06_22635 [Acidobacteriota bacterium]|nr:hypothetical protein [Acidobacteriota bacterium]